MLGLFICSSPFRPQFDWCFSARPELPQTQYIMPLGQPLAGFVPQQFTVKKRRRRQSQRTIKQELPDRAHQQVRAAHDFADLHGVVVNHTSQLIRRHIIAAPDHEITEILSRYEFLEAEISIRE